MKMLQQDSPIFDQLSEFVRISKYARYNPVEKRRETWEEQINRVMDMHKKKYDHLVGNPEFDYLIKNCTDAMLLRKVLGSQRALQFGGESILNKNMRMYNCAASYVDRPSVFSETVYILMCGVGGGYSVQYKHVNQLPTIRSIPNDAEEVKYVIPDTTEGFADATGIVMSQYFTTNQTHPEFFGKNVSFDFSKIRVKGSPIRDTNGKAPGPEPLKLSLVLIKKVIERCLSMGLDRLRPIDCYDIIAHISDAVLAGGVRRSALLILFSPNDQEMAMAKTGSWYIDNPQRGRSNNSALLIRNKTTFEEFLSLYKHIKEYGEPGFIWADHEDTLFNPCVEVSLYGYDEYGNSGFETCNLSTINMKKVENIQDFYECCETASIIGTLQAGYTDFNYLSPATANIVRREALLGVSMTGIMNNPKIAFDADVLRRGAEIVKETNAKVAKLIGINPSARTCCVKPEGTTSCLLNTSDGMHPEHSTRYFRRVQANKLEEPLAYFKKQNPDAVKESVWSSTKSDEVITFLCVSSKNSILKKDVSAIEFLEKVKFVQKHWVQTGRNPERCIQPWLCHNVSNTVTVNPGEWDDVASFIYANRDYFTGISLISNSGDKDYDQAPKQEVLTEEEIAEKYGPAALFASGLIVHAHNAFNGNLYNACACFLGSGEKLETINFHPNDDEIMDHITDAKETLSKLMWLEQAKKFTKRYFDGDKVKMTYCLKDVDALKTWCDLERTYKSVDWTKFIEQVDNTKVEETIACAGGACTFKRI